MEEWNDLRYLLAIARKQTLVAAARELAVNHTTVGRRLAALENALGTRLFNRIDQRLVPTPAGEIAVRRAEQIEAEVIGAATEIAGRDKSLTGRVRITSVSMVVNILASELVGFTERYPDIEVHLMADQQNLDLRHLEADVALRLGRPTTSAAVTRRVGAVNFGVYVSRQFLDQADKLPWVAYTDAMMNLPEARWVATQLKDKRPFARVGDSYARLSVVQSCPCRAILPLVMVPESANLVLLSGPTPVVSRDLWLIYMKELRNSARVKAASEWVSNVCAEKLPY